MHHIFWILSTLLFVFQVSSAQLKDCSRAEYERCVSLADPLLKEPQLVFPDNARDIQLVCVTWNQFVDCLKGYTERCFTPHQRIQFNRAVAKPIDSVHQMCTQKGYQKEYLQYASCIKSTVTLPQHCGTQYNQLVDQVSQGDAISRSSLCCSHDRFKKCVAKETKRLCDRGVPEGNAVRFATQIIDKALSFLQDQCYNYIPNSEDCMSYKSIDDQLLLSTSPWFTTNSRDLDTFSTGFSTGMASNVSPDNNGVSSGGPQESRVTDVSWMPSSDTGETVPSEMMPPSPTGHPIDGHAGFLGSRTRPSSYGRSSAWDTNPSQSKSNPPPLNRQNWATTPLWQIYKETEKNEAPQYDMGSSTDARRRSTTETWYPAAGSYVGNRVDEPNQLGLSKPKNSASNIYFSGTLFTIALTVLFR